MPENYVECFLWRGAGSFYGIQYLINEHKGKYQEPGAHRYEREAKLRQKK